MNSSKIALLSVPMVVLIMGLGFITDSFSDNTAPIVDQSTLTGYVTLTVFDENGQVKQLVENHNLVVDVGLDEMAQAVFGVGGTGSTFFDYIEIGTNSTSPSATDTAILTSACARVQDASPDVNSATSGETSVSVISSFDGGTCAGGIQEAGLFNAVSGNQMLARSTFGTVTIGSGDTLNVNYTVTVT